MTVYRLLLIPASKRDHGQTDGRTNVCRPWVARCQVALGLSAVSARCLRRAVLLGRPVGLLYRLLSLGLSVVRSAV